MLSSWVLYFHYYQNMYCLYWCWPEIIIPYRWLLRTYINWEYINQWCHMVLLIFVNNRSSNGLIPNSAKLLPATMSYQWGALAFNWEEFNVKIITNSLTNGLKKKTIFNTMATFLRRLSFRYNPCHAEFILGNINMYLHFSPFLKMWWQIDRQSQGYLYGPQNKFHSLYENSAI